jgi:hypothetical protein
MNEYDKNALIETLKSIARGIYFGVLGLVSVALTALATSGAINDVMIDVGGLMVNLSFVIVAVVAFIAKTIDKYIHENENIDSRGIAPEFLQR